MVFAVTAKLKDAKRVLDYLQSNDLLDRAFQFKKTKTSISFPAKQSVGIDGATAKKVEDNFFDQTKRPPTLKELLTNILAADEQEQLKTAYDQVGSIAILEIDDQLRGKENEIAQALLKTNANITTVLRKDGAHEGEFRTQRMKFLAGNDTRETIHVESGVKMVVDVERVYFSPRLSTERLRIAQQVAPDENIMVFFCGAAPYPAIFGKKTGAKLVVGIEINPVGHEYGQKTIALNKIGNVKLFCGDVHQVLSKIQTDATLGLPRTYNRIVMNLPKSAHEFLDDALSIAKKGTVIHYYDFLHEDEFDTAVKRIEAACKKRGVDYNVLGIFTCGAQGVRTYRICVDVEIL